MYRPRDHVIAVEKTYDYSSIALLDRISENMVRDELAWRDFIITSPLEIGSMPLEIVGVVGLYTCLMLTSVSWWE